jgi:hypothetical protein
VLAAGLTLTAVPLVTLIFPGVITPVPFAKTAVRLELPPAAIVPGLAVKLVIEAAGGGGVFTVDPPQPASPPNPRLRATAHAAPAKRAFAEF